jgi:hypothetical protein
MLDAGVIIALVALVGAVVTAAFVFLTARQSDLRRRLDTLEKQDRLLWAYCRQLLDHIYRGHGPPPPAPDHLLHDLFPKE